MADVYPMTANRLRGMETAGAALAVVAAGIAAGAPAWGWVACALAMVAVALVLVGAGDGARRLPTWAAVAALLAMSGVSLWVTQTPAETWERTWQLWADLGMFWALAVWARTRGRVALVGAGLAGAGAALALLAPFVVGWFAERKTFFPPSIYAAFPRLVSDTVHPNVMAGALLCAAFIAVAWALWPPRASAGERWLERLPAARALWVLAGVLMLLVLFLTKSRGAYGAFLVGIAVLAALAARRRMALAVVVLVALALAVGGGLWVRQQGATESADELEILDTSSFAFRQRVWHYALLLVGDFPLTGVGMGGFNVALRDLYGYAAFTEPGAHSLYLQVGLDLGLPGLAALLALAAASLRRAIAGLRVLRATGDGLWPLAAGAIAGMAALFAQGLVDITVWGTRGGFMLWGLLALLYGLGSAARWAIAAKNTENAGKQR